MHRSLFPLIVAIVLCACEAGTVGSDVEARVAVAVAEAEARAAEAVAEAEARAPKAAVDDPRFSGDLRDLGMRAEFASFLFDHERDVVSVDLSLSTDQIEDYGSDEAWYIMLTEPDGGGEPGYLLRIDLSGGRNDLHYSNTLDWAYIKSRLKVLGHSGMMQGTIRIDTEPVELSL